LVETTKKGIFMKTTITTAGDFVRAVEVVAIDAVPGSYRVQFSSQLSSARNPQDWQNNFALILSEADLQTLRDVLSVALPVIA
jgi:hypothetical protein